VNPVWVKRCVSLLSGTDTCIAAVAGFPLGATLPEVKAYEAQQLAEAGAREIDMVINIGALKGKDYALVTRDIAAVVRAAQAGGALTKVIIEAALLDDAQKKMACQLACEAGAEFVKTSTGFSIGGATAHDVALMREVVGPKVGVKAAGGIKTYADALTMIAAGANRIGASASVTIMQQAGQATPA
jgi:deoxyribose-phosphate aldolase